MKISIGKEYYSTGKLSAEEAKALIGEINQCGKDTAALTAVVKKWNPSGSRSAEDIAGILNHYRDENIVARTLAEIFPYRDGPCCLPACALQADELLESLPEDVLAKPVECLWNNSEFAHSKPIREWLEKAGWGANITLPKYLADGVTDDFDSSEAEYVEVTYSANAGQNFVEWVTQKYGKIAK